MYTKDDCIKAYNSMLRTVSISHSFSQLYECSAYAEGYLIAMRDLEIIDHLEFFDMLHLKENIENNVVARINDSKVGQF